MLYWIWLTCLQGVGPVTQRSLIDMFSNPKAVYEARLEELELVTGIGKTIASSIIAQKEKAFVKAQKILEASEKNHIKVLITKDKLENYIQPAMNSEANSRIPLVLYYKGELKTYADTVFADSVAIVGARRCTEYGKSVVFEVATYLAQQRITIVSGMAKGIDGYAHTACIKTGGYTIAFLANGLDVCYPPEHHDLMDSITQNGAVISAFPIGTRPNIHNFTSRNNLMSAWAKKVLVVEASSSSGSLPTAEYAMELGKSVYAVPGSIYANESKGCNQLIHKGAKIYLTPAQISEGLKAYKTDKSKSQQHKEPQKNKTICTNPIQQKIVEALSTHKELNLEQLVTLINSEKLKILENISILDLEDVIVSLPCQRYKIRQ